MDNDSVTSLRPLLLERWQLLGSIIVDSLFLGAWLGVLWLFDWTTEHLTHNGPLEWRIAKLILAISTLALIALFLYWDFRTAALRLRQSYQQERETLMQRPRLELGGTNDLPPD